MADSNPDSFATPAKAASDEPPPPTAEQTRLNLLKLTPTLDVGNFSFIVPTKAKTSVLVTGALFKKEHRPAEGSEDERHLILAICADLKSTYELLTTSSKDPNMLKTTYSLSKLITNTKNHFIKYDLADPFLLVYPMAKPNTHALKLKSIGVPTTTDLWTEFHRVTADDVAASCTYYHLYGDSSTNIDRTLRWSYRYFEKNVETTLFNRINNTFLDYETTAQGGPLFFKLLVDALSVSNDAQLLALQAVVYKYNIKSDCEAEDINDAVAMLKGITESIYSAKENVLPEQYVRKLLLVFQTTSVSPFNEEFKRLEQDLDRIETIREIDPNRLLAMKALGTTLMENDLQSAKYIFSYALITYRKSQQNGQWDNHVRSPPGVSSFSASTGPFKMICFNCGEIGHKVGEDECKLPIDQRRIDANKQKFRKSKNASLNATNSKWKPPIPSEGGKRIIGGNPFTWSNPWNKWVQDKAPPTGLAAAIPATTTPVAPKTVPPVIDATEEQPSDDITTASTVAQLQIQMAALQRKLASVQDSMG